MLFYGIDLIGVTALGSVLALAGAGSFLLALLMALWLVLFPLIGALARRNKSLFFLTASVTVGAAVIAVPSSNLVVFDVAYIFLLLFSLLTAFAVSIHVNS